MYGGDMGKEGGEETNYTVLLSLDKKMSLPIAPLHSVLCVVCCVLCVV